MLMMDATAADIFGAVNFGLPAGVRVDVERELMEFSGESIIFWRSKSIKRV
jgi:hypothetical protein